MHGKRATDWANGSWEKNRPSDLRASGLGMLKEGLPWAYMQQGLVVEVGLHWWVLGLDLEPI